MTNYLASVNNPALGVRWNLLLGTDKGGATFIAALINNFISLGIVFGAIFFFFYFIFGAIKMITAGGDKANVESARKHITNALVGIVLLISMYAVIQLIEGIFGVDIATINFSNYRL